VSGLALISSLQSVLVVKPVDLYNFVDLEDDIPEEEEEDDEEGDEQSVDEDGDEDKDDDDQARKSTHGKVMSHPQRLALDFKEHCFGLIIVTAADDRSV